MMKEFISKSNNLVNMVRQIESNNIGLKKKILELKENNPTAKDMLKINYFTEKIQFPGLKSASDIINDIHKLSVIYEEDKMKDLLKLADVK